MRIWAKKTLKKPLQTNKQNMLAFGHIFKWASLCLQQRRPKPKLVSLSKSAPRQGRGGGTLGIGPPNMASATYEWAAGG